MTRSWYTFTHRALARGLQIAALAGCLVAGAGISQSVAHAASLGGTPIIIAGPCGTYAKHDVLLAGGRNAYVYVAGTCFPPLSTAYITIRDRTRGVVLAQSVAVRVSGMGGFQYQVQGTYPNDKVRIRVTDGAWHGTLNITVQDFIP